jgi:hypothetical protein
MYQHFVTEYVSCVEITDTILEHNFVRYPTHFVQSEFLPLEIMQRNRSLNCIVINSWFLLASAYRLKQLKGIRRREFLSEFHVGRVPGCTEEIRAYEVGIFSGCTGGTAFPLCAITASVAAFPTPNGTAAKCPHYNLRTSIAHYVLIF